MNCPGCKHSFDQESHLPVLLSACGHSLCLQCAEVRFSEGGVRCHKCSRVSKASSPREFPRNLSLLEIFASAKVPPPPFKDIVDPSAVSEFYELASTDPLLEKGKDTRYLEFDKESMPLPDGLATSQRQGWNEPDPFACLASLTDEDSEFRTSASRRKTAEGASCPQHNKPIQAFCLTDWQFFCLNCVLENKHSGHRIKDIETSAVEVRTAVVSRINAMSGSQCSFKRLSELLSQKLKMLSETSNLYVAKIELVFGELQTQLANTRKELIGCLRLADEESGEGGGGGSGPGAVAAGRWAEPVEQHQVSDSEIRKRGF